MVKKIINYIFIFFVSIAIILFVIDVISIINNPEEYRTAQGFMEEELSLSSPSVKNYLISNFLWIAGLIFFLFVGIKNNQRKKHKLFTPIYYTCLVLFFTAVIYGFYDWIVNGY